MKFYYAYVLILLIFVTCKTDNSTNQTEVNKSGLVKIDMPRSYDMNSKLSDVFKELLILPLETNEDCQIVFPTKVIVHNSMYYVLDMLRALYVFDSHGAFQGEIGKKGKGPGEFLEIRDFDIDDEGNILILDFKRILKYSNTGKFIGNETYFEFLGKDFYCNPCQFACLSESDYLIWGGTMGIKTIKNNQFAMYRLNKGKLVERYFPLKLKLTDDQHRFVRNNDGYLIVPTIGNDTIFSVSNKTVKARYHVNFYNGIDPSNVPTDMKSSSMFKSEVYYNSDISHSIRNPLEHANWLSFAFDFHQKQINTFINKEEMKIFTFFGKKKGHPLPYRLDFVKKDAFCGIVSALDFTKIIKLLKDSNNTLPFKYINNNKVNPNDNHVILIYTLR